MDYVAALYILAGLAAAHGIVMATYSLAVNPYETSFFIRIFPYHFLYNLFFSNSRYKTRRSYFSLRVDVNTSRRGVREHNDGLRRLIEIADRHEVPVTVAIAAEYLPALSDEVIQLLREGPHEVISHATHHDDITRRDQHAEIAASKKQLEAAFDCDVRGMVAPQGKHDLETLTAARHTGLSYISAGAAAHIRYWSFPYPFKKRGMWLLGGAVPSDHYLYTKKQRTPASALKTWKKSIAYRADRGWYIQLGYHNSSTSGEQLAALDRVLAMAAAHEDIVPVTQGTLVDVVQQKRSGSDAPNLFK